MDDLEESVPVHSKSWKRLLCLMIVVVMKWGMIKYDMFHPDGRNPEAVSRRYLARSLVMKASSRTWRDLGESRSD